jgi:hypothetical protein
MDELYNEPKNQHVSFREILRLSEAKLQGTDISASLIKVQKQAEAKNKKKILTRVDPTVKTPGESGKAQGTAGHP